MRYDLSAIPDVHDGLSLTAMGEFESPAAELGLVAVASALAPLLGPMDQELRELFDRGKRFLTALRPALAS